MPQEVLDLHRGGSPYHHNLLLRVAFVNIQDSSLADIVELVTVRPDDIERPFVDEPFQLRCRVLHGNTMSYSPRR